MNATLGTEPGVRMPDAGDGTSLPRVLAIAGSLREGSFNRALLRAFRELASGAAEVRIDRSLGEIPLFDEDREEPAPPAVAELRRRIREADLVLFASPEYNHSIPGVLKNAVDWASRPYGESVLADKPVAVIGASPSRRGAAEAQKDLRKVLRSCGAEVLDVELALSRAHRRFDDDRTLIDDEIRDELAAVVRRVVRAARERANR